MLQLILIVIIGIAIGWTMGRSMEATEHATRDNMAVGAFGALAATALTRWAGMDGKESLASGIAVGIAGALMTTFLVGLVRQWWAPGPWVAERERQRANRLAPHPAAEANLPSLARTVTRSQPLLVLHASRTLRCWPADGDRWSRGDGETDRLDWIVEIDGHDLHAGPSSAASSTRGEVAAGVRAWWDSIELQAAVARGRIELQRPHGS